MNIIITVDLCQEKNFFVLKRIQKLIKKLKKITKCDNIISKKERSVFYN